MAPVLQDGVHPALTEGVPGGHLVDLNGVDAVAQLVFEEVLGHGGVRLGADPRLDRERHGLGALRVGERRGLARHVRRPAAGNGDETGGADERDQRCAQTSHVRPPFRCGAVSAA